MRILLPALLFATACAHMHHGHVDGGVLGRVVVYRNGVAFYARDAKITDGKLTVHVPRDRVDDFLKSLTVTDKATRKPLSVAIPRKEAADGSYLTMTVETPGVSRADVLLTYVTEAPAWKPSYRIVVKPGGHVMLEGWAIVDNTTTEDWKGVLVGVGASSALAFRYDLWSVRTVDRDLLAGEERFAIAPPTGVSPYGGSEGAEELVDLDQTEVRGDAVVGAAAGSQNDKLGVSFSGSSSVDNAYVVDGLTRGVTGVVRDMSTKELLPGVTVVASGKGDNQAAITDEKGRYSIPLPAGKYTITFYFGDLQVQRGNVAVRDNKVATVDQNLRPSAAGGETIKITSSAPTIDPTSTTQGITIDNNYTMNIPVPGRTFDGSISTAPRREPPKPPPPIAQGDEKLHAIAEKFFKAKKDIIIEAHGAAGTEKEVASRAQAVVNKLVDDGIPSTKIHVVPKLDGGTGIRVLAIAPVDPAKNITAPPTANTRDLGGDTPVGESHFMAEKPMTVKAGSSAMVAVLHEATTGGVVYLYDPISERGDQRFAFKAVKLDNPTDDALEPGPMTVYGDDDRFIGEGITEPVPARASVVVPFALDKEIVVTQKGADEDRIAKLLTLQRGVLTAEVQHRRTTTFAVTNRLASPQKVFLRHRLAEGWKLIDAPARMTHIGDSQLFEVDVAPHSTLNVVIAEATPVERTFELGSDQALGMLKVYIDEPDASPALKQQIADLLATHRSAADLADKIATHRDEIAEYRARVSDLHAQLLTLKAVKTGGALMASLRGKLDETNDRIQKLTLEIVSTQEEMMLARVKFQNQLAELRLEDVTRVSDR